MRATFSQIKKLRVETRNGTPLGKVRNLILDTDTQNIVQYEVSSSPLKHPSYLIHRDQVVSIDENKMIVHDSAATEKPAIKSTGIPQTSEALSLRDSA